MVLLAGTALLGSGCAERPFHKTQNFERNQSVFIDATQRAVINNPLSAGAWGAPGQVVPKRIICTEPSPDVATATAQSFGAALEASVRNAGGGAARLDASTAQALLKLAERSVTIQYLRDGLYQACQAYANGAITSTTYSLILGGIDETLATTMMAEAAAGTVQDGNAAVGAWATSSGDVPSGASGSGAADQSQATAQTAGSGESGGANPKASSTVPAKATQTAGVDLPQTAPVTPNAGGESSKDASKAPPKTNQTAGVILPQTAPFKGTADAGVAAEIARMHAAFVNDAGFDSVMLACVAALDRPPSPSGTALSNICKGLVGPEPLEAFGQASDRRVIALAALELASSQARALEAAARACAPGGDGENCKALRAALPSGANSMALVHEVLSYAKEDIPTSTRRDVTAAHQYTPLKAAYRQ